jgi:cytochrome c-type biogenesis protein CcmH
MALFFLFAALMLAAALAFVLPPLLRGPRSTGVPAKIKALDDAHAVGVLNDTEYAAKRAALGAQQPAAAPTRARSTQIATIALALLLPAASILLYRYVGNPDALQPDALTASADHGQSMEQAIAGLAAKLKQNPEDVEGWSLLGRAYEATERFADARDALAHAHALAKDDNEVTVAYAEALALSTESRRVEGEPRALIESVLKTTPDNQRGLWLLGISDYQRGQYDAAIADWNRLLAVLPKESDIVPSVREQIAQAEAARDGRAPVARQPTPTDTAPASNPQLQVQVALDAKLKDKVAPNDVLFVYAKAASGPPMPLAIQRLTADKLPTSVTLTDAMGMLPNMKLSQFPQVVVGARVSKSGNAIAQSGDLQAISAPLDVTTATPIKLTIDQIVP